MTDGQVRALVVDDDPAWQEIMAEILQDAGVQADISSSYEEAVKCLNAGTYRLAVVDLSLTDHHDGRDGLRVLDALRTLAPGCAAVLLTGYATVDVAVGAVTEYGAYTCLRKEAFRRAHFRQLLGRILAVPRPDGSPAAAPTPPPQGAADSHPDVLPALAAIERMTARERQILELLVLGLTNKEISSRLLISINTVKAYLKSIFEKLGVSSRSAAVALAVSARVRKP